VTSPLEVSTPSLQRNSAPSPSPCLRHVPRPHLLSACSDSQSSFFQHVFQRARVLRVILTAKDSYFAHSCRRLRVGNMRPRSCSPDRCQHRISSGICLSHGFPEITTDLLFALEGLMLTVARLRLTARRAATVEPTIQKPISKSRALTNKPPSNSTVLSSMHASFRL
jgi:hypothetical protein